MSTGWPGKVKRLHYTRKKVVVDQIVRIVYEMGDKLKVTTEKQVARTMIRVAEERRQIGSNHREVQYLFNYPDKETDRNKGWERKVKKEGAKNPIKKLTNRSIVIKSDEK